MIKKKINSDRSNIMLENGFKQKFNNSKTKNNKNSSVKGTKETNKPVKEKGITDWFYMSKQELTAKKLEGYLRTLELGELDLWEELNILSLELKEGASIDFEGMPGGFEGEADIVFMKENGYQTVFTVTVSEDNPFTRDVFKEILNQFQGAFCADTEDFKPCIKTRE